MSENDIDRFEREAIERLESLLMLPSPDGKWRVGDSFDPWTLFPLLYGSYSSEFDRCALDVLDELMSGEKKRTDLGAEMFREMLCNVGLCDYGMSPRTCFPVGRFVELLPALLAKWTEYSKIQWAPEQF